MSMANADLFEWAGGLQQAASLRDFRCGATDVRRPVGLKLWRRNPSKGTTSGIIEAMSFGPKA